MTESIPQKRCTKCGEVKPATTEYFYTHNRYRDHLDYHCKECFKRKFNKYIPAPPGYKRCSICQQEKPATTEFFHHHKGQRNDLAGWCRVCAKQRRRKQPRLDSSITHKKCTKCLEEYPATAEYFHKSNDGVNGLRGDCKLCNLWIREKYRVRNKERISKRQRERYPSYDVTKSRNRRALEKEATGSHTKEDIEKQYAFQNGKCYYCEQNLAEYHVDHYIPLSRGGSNGPENLVIACPHCNVSKNNKLPGEWIQWRFVKALHAKKHGLN